MEPYVNCYDTVIKLFEWGTEIFEQEYTHCQQGVFGIMPTMVGVAVVSTLLAHYAAQFVFFKVVIDFVALGKIKN